ncbi:Carboxylic ester hydrolase [Dirofilaria immitis]|nr:Carboxylic ester hydrolase [Dirofilaria immitis]
MLYLKFWSGNTDKDDLLGCGGRTMMQPYFATFYLFLFNTVETAHTIRPTYNNEPIVHTKLGIIRGLKQKFEDTFVNAYLGIPFAQPPIGNRRFALPEMIQPWPGELNAQKLARTCYVTPDRLFGVKYVGTEKHDGQVMVWIYGGGFYSGSPSLDLYDGRVLASRQKTIIARSVWFLYLGDKSTIPGNMGLMDQQLALRWIYENIASFGGDANKITLFGESAGAASVTAHFLHQEKAADAVSVDQILPMTFPFVPVEEDEHFSRFETNESFIRLALCFAKGATILSGNLFTKLKMRDFTKDLSVLIGSMKDEGTYWLPYYFLNPKMGFQFNHTISADDPSNRALINREQYTSSIQSFLPYFDDSQLVKHALLHAYAEICESNDPEERLRDGVARFIANPWPKWMGVMHGYEIEYVFGQPFRHSHLYSESQLDSEKRFSEAIMKYWTTFAAEGVPRPQWPKYNKVTRKAFILNDGIIDNNHQITIDVHGKSCNLLSEAQAIVNHKCNAKDDAYIWLRGGDIMSVGVIVGLDLNHELINDHVPYNFCALFLIHSSLSDKACLLYEKRSKMKVHRASTMLLGSLDMKAKTARVFHQLMLSKALIAQEHKGIYSILPIVIETELDAIGAYKISMPILGAKEIWQKADRWSTFESEMFHLSDKTNQTFCLQPTHEEMVTKLVAEQDAYNRKGYTADSFIGILESRLSAILYHSGLVPTIYSAKQLISHKHVTVNGRVVNISSYRVRPGDIVRIRESAVKIPIVIETTEKQERKAPGYLETNSDLRQTVYPLMLYQTGPKFRDEIAVGYGLLRSREFLMNDLYSFDITEKNASDTYNLVNETYQRIFRDRLGINFYIVRADTGNIGGDMSHEYHLPCKTGRDSIVYCSKCNSGISHDLLNRGEKACCCIDECASAEHLRQPLKMNCFGIGIGRMIAALIDSLSPSAKALRLPYALTPFKVAVILPNKTQPETMAFAEDIIGRLSQISSLQNDIFVDDRLDNSIGRRLIAASNLGIPHILVIGNRTARSFTSNPVIEYYRTEVHSDEPINAGDLQYDEISKFIIKL